MLLIERLLLRDETLKLDPYRDSLGFWTVGVGHLIDRRKGGKLPSWVQPSFPLSEQDATEMMKADVAEGMIGLERALPWFATLDEIRRTVLLSMAFQMGVDGVLEFRSTLRAVSERRWGDAANGMRDSKWYGQTTARAERLATAMLTGSEDALKLGG